MNELMGYHNAYWDSDEYEDDNDVGYMRQLVEDETWFLAHEFGYQTDNNGTGRGSVSDPIEWGQNKKDEDDKSFAEENSYIFGERWFQWKNSYPVKEIYRRDTKNDFRGDMMHILLGF